MANEESPYKADQLGYEDAFGKLIADSTSNVADISANYPYNPERWRVFYNGNRRLIQYGDDANYSDNVDGHVLSPNAGDVMRMETAESYRYVVQYVVRPSWAFQISQELQGNDKVTIGFGTADLENNMAAADGWIMEIEPDGVYFSTYRNGTVTSNGGNRKPLNLNTSPQIWGRYALDVNWYNVGKSELIETYTEDAEQFNPRVAKISSDDRKGPERAIQPIEFSVRADPSTTNLELEIGSVAFVVLGDAQSIYRSKTFAREYSLTTTGAWEPLLAMRIDPNREKIATFLESLSALNYSASDTIRVQAQSFDPSKVTFDGTDSWSTPDELSSSNAAIEIRDDINGIPDNTGTVGSTAINLGGWQIGSAVLTVSNLQGASFNVQPSQQKTKRPIYGSDVIAILGRSETTGELSFDVNIRQDF